MLPVMRVGTTTTALTSLSGKTTTSAAISPSPQMKCAAMEIHDVVTVDGSSDFVITVNESGC